MKIATFLIIATHYTFTQKTLQKSLYKLLTVNHNTMMIV